MRSDVFLNSIIVVQCLFKLILPSPLFGHLNLTINASQPPAASADFRHNYLRDFVATGRRGKGSISRLSFEHGTDPLQLPDPDLSSKTAHGTAGGDSAEVNLETPNFQPFKIVMPSNMRKTPSSAEKNEQRAPKIMNNNNSSSPSPNEKIAKKKLPDDFEKLSKILQEFMSHQQQSKKQLKKIAMSKPLNISKIQTIVDEPRKDDDDDVEQLEHDGTINNEKKKGSIGNKRVWPQPTSLLSATNGTARGTVLGTVPLSVEIGGNAEDDDEDEQNLRQNLRQQQMIITDHGPIVSHGEVIGQERTEKFVDKLDKLLVKQEKAIDAATDAKSWDGSVERVTTLNMMSSSPTLSSTTASSADQQKLKSEQSIEKQLFGRIIIEQQQQQKQRQNRTNGNKIEMDHDGQQQAFFYQIQDDTNGGKSSKENAIVEILREGFARQLDSSMYVFVASITLIRDGGKTILVDTGMGTDINGRTDLIRKLSDHKIAPPAVDYVVITHGHPDHAGNTNDFPDAIHFQGVMSHYRTKFNFSNLFENAKHQLTENVALISTPGHTSEDISVIVTNALDYGTVVVSGDVFIAAEDLSRPMMWRPLAWNETVQQQQRHMILCMADYVVPGHGKMFRLSETIRREANCSKMMENL